jgi:hypothetical protein
MGGCTALPFPLTLDGGLLPGQDAGNSTAVEPTLQSLQAKVFTPSCAFASCHGGSNPVANLSLKDGESRGAVVGQTSTFTAPDGGTLFLVVPGHPEQSILLAKVEKTSAELQALGYGTRMPQGSNALPSDRIEAIRQWIADGAQDN